jgi:tol-pal system protein YbgF
MNQSLVMSRTFMSIVVGLSLLAPAASALAADKEQRQLMADIRMLQEQTQQLQNLIGALGEALKTVHARLDEQATTNRKAFADQKVIIDNLANDLRVVREKVDDNNVRISSLFQEVDALRQAVQQQVAAARASVPSEAPDGAIPADGVSPPPAPVPAPPATPVAPIGMSPTRLYDMAFSNYTSGLWDLAIDGFDSYIRSFPKSDMADDAQVYIGNAYLQDGKNDKAVQAYDQAIRTYPSGNAIPDAYYKKGLALMNLKQLDLAREAFELAVKSYPDSDAGRLARQKLVQLATTTPSAPSGR